ncbi:MAG TPA: thiamine phosphate synthase [Longimicrobiales bacterium]|nr:thiamine phosphate synthase [Longimicrobiales bacterium]
MIVPRLHLVTDAATIRDPGFPARVKEAVAAGGPDVAVHLRGHGIAAGDMYRLATDLVPAILDAGAWLLVNDRIDLAMIIAAHWPGMPVGAQIGVRSIPVGEARRLLGREAPIGYSAHAVTEAVDAGEVGATFNLFGSVFSTPSHPGAEPAGVDALAGAARVSPVPVIAIGGVAPERVPALLAAGAHGVAVLSGVWHAPDVAYAASQYVEALISATADVGGR